MKHHRISENNTRVAKGVSRRHDRLEDLQESINTQWLQINKSVRLTHNGIGTLIIELKSNERIDEVHSTRNATTLSVSQMILDHC